MDNLDVNVTDIQAAGPECALLDCCRYLMMFMMQFNATADRLVTALSRVANGQTVFSMNQYFCHVAMDVIAEVS